MLILRNALVAAALFLACAVAQPSPLPAYSATGDLLFNLSPPNRIFPVGFGSFSLTNPSFGSISTSAFGTPFPSLAASSSIGPNLAPSIFGRGSELLFYAFEIVGPSGFVPVLIDVAGAATGSSTVGGSFAVESRWDLLGAGGAVLAGDDVRSGQLSGSFSQSFSHTVAVTLAANQIYTVFMLADAAAAATLAGSQAIADAFVDPIISFAPGVDSSIYSLSFSDGIGNSKAVGIPEPATLALLGAVLLPLGLRRRFRIAGLASSQ